MCVINSSSRDFAPHSGMRVKINGRCFSLSWDDFLKALINNDDLAAIEVVMPGLLVAGGDR